MCSVVDLLISEVLEEISELFAAIVEISSGGVEVKLSVINKFFQFSINASKADSGNSISKERNIYVSESSELIKDTVYLAESIK